MKQETKQLIEDRKELNIRDRVGATHEVEQTQESKVTLEQCQKLINRRVRIINPNAGEPDQGYIKPVGSFFVTITKTNGDKIKRAAKNLRLPKNE